MKTRFLLRVTHPVLSRNLYLHRSSTTLTTKDAIIPYSMCRQYVNVANIVRWLSTESMHWTSAKQIATVSMTNEDYLQTVLPGCEITVVKKRFKK